MTNQEINTLIATNFLKYKKVDVSYCGCEYKDEAGGWQHIREYSSDLETAWALMDELTQRGAIVTYKTMLNGKRGHFITLGYLENQFNSFHTFCEAAGESFPQALCLAILRSLNL